MRAVIYARISRDPNHDELGVMRQEVDCRRLCERLGHDVVDVVVDDDRSAYSGKRRPGLEQVKDMLRSKAADVLVAWHPDRITRHPRELEDIIDLLNTARATVHTVQSGEYDLSTESGRMTARIVGAVARHESEHKSARLRRKHEELAQAGKVSGGGDRPFGYQADRVTIDEAEAEAVREAAAWVLGGGTLRSLVADWDRRQIRTPSGRRWTQPPLRRMLGSARIAGLREHHGVVAATAVWPAIISPDDHRALVALFTSRRPARAPRRYVLGGLLFCSTCGSKLVARPRGDGRRCYVCSRDLGGCGKRRQLADPIEELVVDAVLARMAGALPAVAEDGPDVVGALEALDARMVELGEMWAAREIDRAGWRSARARLEAERAALAASMATATRRRSARSLPSDPDGLRAAWEELGIEQRRDLLGDYVERIELDAAMKGRNFFDPDRVRVVWAA